MRVRKKQCHQCSEIKDALYRCRFGRSTDWVFMCGKCLETIKATFADTYQYGGTWKSKKK